MLSSLVLPHLPLPDLPPARERVETALRRLFDGIGT